MAHPSPPDAKGATRPTGSGAPAQSVIVRAYPKVIFFWPTWVLSLASAFLAGSPSEGNQLGTVWVCLFAFNLLVISFDFTEVISLLVLAVLATVVFAGLYFDFLPLLGTFFRDLGVHMNRAFYWAMFGLFSIIYGFVFLRTRFDYWEFRFNEVIHRRGLFADLKRYSTEDLRWFKEVPDVLERVMCGSGRMVLTTPREHAPIVIEHVIGIGRIDERVADILGTKRVTID